MKLEKLVLINVCKQSGKPRRAVRSHTLQHQKQQHSPALIAFAEGYRCFHRLFFTLPVKSSNSLML